MTTSMLKPSERYPWPTNNGSLSSHKRFTIQNLLGYRLEKMFRMYAKVSLTVTLVGCRCMSLRRILKVNSRPVRQLNGVPGSRNTYFHFGRAEKNKKKLESFVPVILNIWQVKTTSTWLLRLRSYSKYIMRLSKDRIAAASRSNGDSIWRIPFHAPLTLSCWGYLLEAWTETTEAFFTTCCD